MIKNKIKHFSIKIIFLFIFCIIPYCRSITTELKIIKSQYITIKTNDNKLRKISTQDVFGSAFNINYYYSNLYLGEKKKKQGYILDTGSSITTSTCEQLCEECGNHINPHHKIKNLKNILSCGSKRCELVSSQCNLNKKDKCTFSISYAEGSSLTGVYINELVRFGKNYENQKGIYIPIGCTQKETHLFLKQEADGIMGLSNTEKNFVDILYKFDAIDKRMFGMCFGQLGGYFTIGEINNKYHLEKMKFVEMKNKNDDYFTFELKSIKVNNTTINNIDMNQYTNFLDSGTTISYFPSAFYDGIISIFQKECQKFGYNKCGKYIGDSDLGAHFSFDNITHLNNAVKYFWPIITFELNDYEYNWKPENYLLNGSTNEKVEAYIGFSKDGSKRFTFGGTWFIGHDIVFDRENKLIGFAEANCFQNKKINITNGLEILYNFNKLSLIEKNKIIMIYVISLIFISLLILSIIFVIINVKKNIVQRNQKIIIKNVSNNSAKVSYINEKENEKKKTYHVLNETK